MTHFFAVALLFTLSLTLWRGSYSGHYVSVLALVPLWACTFLGTYRNIVDKRRSLLLATLKQSSGLIKLLTGRFVPALISMAISLFSVLLFAFSMLLAEPIQVFAAAAIVVTSALLYFMLLRMMRRHINDLAISWFAASSATAILSVSFFVPYAIMEWAFVQRPGFIRLEFDEAMLHALQGLPQRGDWINELFLLFSAAEYAKLWLAARFTGTAIPGVLYAAHSALICFAIASCAVGVASFCYHYLPKTPDWRTPQSQGAER